MMTNLVRVLKMAFIGIWRNGWLSVTAISVFFLVFLMVNVFVLFGNSFDQAIRSIEQKVDFTIFFDPDAPEADILALRDTVATNPLVKETNYVSKDKAFEIFLQQKPEFRQAVRDYGNPFSASLDIKATDPTRLAEVAASFEGNTLVKKVKYSQQTVDTINKGTKILRNAGIFLIAFLIIIALLVVLNTVRLAIYTRRQEIEIMRLVGATGWYIRWPFIFEAIFDAVIAAVLSTTVLYFAFERFSGQLVDLSYLLKIPSPVYGVREALRFGLYQIVAGSLLASFSALLAIRRHMKI